MQKFEGTVITDNGLNLLTTVNGGGDKIQYTKAVLASDDFTQASATAIQKITDLKIKMSSSISINSRINDTINLSASFTNETITEDFDFYCIGWYAKGVKDSTEYLIAVSPSTVKQTMPAGSNNAATAAISPKYAMTLSRSAEVVVNTNPAGSVTKEYVDNQINALIAEGIINNGSIVSTTDDCNKMITTSYHLVKGSLPLNAPDGFSTNGQIIVYGNKDTTDGVTQLAYDDINGVSYVRSYNPTNNQWSTWDLIITKSQLHAVLPTDIARTGETNEFKAKNTFDVDPVNKDGNSYGLAKDIDTKVTDNGDNSIEINKQAVTPVRDNKDGSINFNGKHMTPADDSKVVHTYNTSGSIIIRTYLTTGTDLNTVTQPGIFPFNSCTFVNDINNWTKWGAIINNVFPNQIIRQEMIQGNGQIYGYRIYNGGNSTWSNWLIPADDSKVAHLSGANNFDTTPTVNNNPLLLASSLPSDLARTGQAQTFTAAQTFSIAPTITDASTDKGDNQAATMADLKSVEESAWRQLDSSKLSASIVNNTDSSKLSASAVQDSLCLYRIDETDKKIYFFIMVNTSGEDQYTFTLDFSNVVDSITKVGPGSIFSNVRGAPIYSYAASICNFTASGAKLEFTNNAANAIYAMIVSGQMDDCWFSYNSLLV